MNKLEMIKAFAELEGVDIIININGEPLLNNGRDDVYNPITDLALNCAARDKYAVKIDYFEREVSLCNGYYFSLFDNSGCIAIAKAVIEAILKSRGLWK